MLQNKYLKDWSKIVSNHFSHLSLPQVVGLATGRFRGMVITGSSSLKASFRIPIPKSMGKKVIPSNKDSKNGIRILMRKKAKNEEN